MRRPLRSAFRMSKGVYLGFDLLTYFVLWVERLLGLVIMSTHFYVVYVDPYLYVVCMFCMLFHFCMSLRFYLE